ncbi:unnamed protein product [Miscanthus lutarioriparius]|uniref:BSD domain-containing protein n=1 Tax=Miscanthus lutarioriparius TaxID=422564 RepID=A0A811SIX9_9POAL|nr:unnamed protein product [Miscanthus lutarioriparius]
MTDAQQDHALAVESLAPELADLRIELCPSHMSEGCFWKIYFVLLHPKLRKDDAEILSTAQLKQPLADISEQSRVDIQKTDNVEDGDMVKMTMGMNGWKRRQVTQETQKFNSR